LKPMAIFCTKCGTSNADTDAFCEHCGAALRKPEVLLRPLEGGPQRRARESRKILYASVALGSVLVAGVVAAYFALTPPAPTNARLLAAAKAGHGEGLLQRSKRELCLSNMDYGVDKFNAAQYDTRTQSWLNTLVEAGLYSPGEAVIGGGYFSSPLVQYAATPELMKWRDGRRLCLAKGVEIADVVDIQEPSEKALGNDAAAPKLHTVAAKLVLQATDAAPWLEKANVQSELLGQLPGWEYQGGKLQKQVPDVFGLRDGQWATGPAYKAELEKQYASTQRARSGQGKNVAAASGGGLFAGLAKLFSFGGHPLQGKWHMDTAGSGPFGRATQSASLGMTFTFTSDAMEMGGASIKCNFEVDGNRVKVTPEGAAESYIFEMRDKNTAIVDLGMFQLTYKRVQ
jgi:hypothetical protein